MILVVFYLLIVILTLTFSIKDKRPMARVVLFTILIPLMAMILERIVRNILNAGTVSTAICYFLLLILHFLAPYITFRANGYKLPKWIFYAVGFFAVFLLIVEIGAASYVRNLANDVQNGGVIYSDSDSVKLRETYYLLSMICILAPTPIVELGFLLKELTGKKK